MTRTRPAVVADPHLSPTGRASWKVYHRSAQRFRAALAAADRCRADAVPWGEQWR